MHYGPPRPKAYLTLIQAILNLCLPHLSLRTVSALAPSHEPPPTAEHHMLPLPLDGHCDTRFLKILMTNGFPEEQEACVYGPISSLSGLNGLAAENIISRNPDFSLLVWRRIKE